MYRGGGKPGRKCPGSGSWNSGYHKGQRYVDWLNQNFCVHCNKPCIKGLYKCPECNLRVRIVPHNTKNGHGVKRLAKDAQVEAAAMLVIKNYKPPPISYSARRWL